MNDCPVSPPNWSGSRSTSSSRREPGGLRGEAGDVHHPHRDGHRRQSRRERYRGELLAPGREHHGIVLLLGRAQREAYRAREAGRSGSHSGGSPGQPGQSRHGGAPPRDAGAGPGAQGRPFSRSTCGGSKSWRRRSRRRGSRRKRWPSWRTGCSCRTARRSPTSRSRTGCRASAREFCEAGGLLAYGVDFPFIWRQGAVLVDKIFKGAKPADLPIQSATRFEFVVNLKTARALGLPLPPSAGPGGSGDQGVSRMPGVAETAPAGGRMTGSS